MSQFPKNVSGFLKMWPALQKNDKIFFQESETQYWENRTHFWKSGKHFREISTHFQETETHFWETGTPFLGNLGLLLELLIRFIIKRFIDFGKLGLTICPRVNIHHRKKIKNLILHGVTPLMGFLMVHYVGDIGPEWGETGGALRWMRWGKISVQQSLYRPLWIASKRLQLCYCLFDV